MDWSCSWPVVGVASCRGFVPYGVGNGLVVRILSMPSLILSLVLSASLSYTAISYPYQILSCLSSSLPQHSSCFPSVNVLSPPSPSSSPFPSHLHSHLLCPCPSPSPLPPPHPPHSPSPPPLSTAPTQSSLSETEVSFAAYSASIPQQSASFSPAQISPTPKKTLG